MTDDGGYEVREETLIDKTSRGQLSPLEEGSHAATRAQIKAEMHAAIDHNDALFLATLGPPSPKTLADDPDAEFDIALISTVAGKVGSIAELYYATFEHAIDRYANMMEIPLPLAAIEFFQRLLSEHIDDVDDDEE